MKVAVIGHTSGIGKSLYNRFLKESFKVVGFNKKSGYDISIDTNRKKIIEQIYDYDIFINNAWHLTGQGDMLQEIINCWEGTTKNIINISSNIRALPESFFKHSILVEYRDSKNKIDNLINQYVGSLSIMNTFPELTKTNFKLNIPDFNITDGMDSDYVADLIYQEFLCNPTNKDFTIKHLKYAN